MLAVVFSQPLGTIFIFIAAATPNRASLGTTNGLSQVRLGHCILQKMIFYSLFRWRWALCAPSPQRLQIHYTPFLSRKVIAGGTWCITSSCWSWSRHCTSECYFLGISEPIGASQIWPQILLADIICSPKKTSHEIPCPLRFSSEGCIIAVTKGVFARTGLFHECQEKYDFHWQVVLSLDYDLHMKAWFDRRNFGFKVWPTPAADSTWLGPSWMVELSPFAHSALIFLSDHEWSSWGGRGTVAHLPISHSAQFSATFTWRTLWQSSCKSWDRACDLRIWECRGTVCVVMLPLRRALIFSDSQLILWVNNQLFNLIRSRILYLYRTILFRKLYNAYLEFVIYRIFKVVP